MKRLKREKGEGRKVEEYAPRLECVSALCMFCTFCRFLHRRPTVRLAHVLVYLALVLVDLCTSITARQKKTFSPISATRLLFFPYLIFVALSMLRLKTTLATPNNVQPLGQNKQHTFLTFNQNGRKRELLFLVCCVSLSRTFSFSGRLSGARKGRPLMNQSASVTDGNATLT